MGKQPADVEHGRQQDQQTPINTAVWTALRDPARLAVLRRIGLLDTPPEETFDRLLRLTVSSVHTPMVMLALLDDSRHFLKSSIGVPEPWGSRRSMPLSHSICRYTIGLGQPLVIDDTRQHAWVRESPAISDIGAIAYAGIPLSLAAGHIVGTLCAIDSRPRAWTADELAALQDLAACATAELERRAIAWHQVEHEAFLGIASHELKTPLTSLKMQTQVTLRRLNQAGLTDQVENVRRMERAIRRMEHLISDLLDSSAIEEGQMVLRRERADMRRLCADGAEEQMAATERAVALDLPDKPVWVDVDAGRIGQVLANLLTNALKFSPEDEPVSLRLRYDDHAATVSVHDWGAGVPPEAVPHLFQRFFRVPGVDVQSGSAVGLGLGLYISRALVEQHGGQLWVARAAGSGSTFSFTLPLAQPPSA